MQEAEVWRYLLIYLVIYLFFIVSAIAISDKK